MLTVSGTHGDGRLSGLNDERSLVHDFYTEDCRRVGVEAGYRRVRGLPLRTWDGLPTIDKPAVRIEPPPPDSFYADEDLKHMDIRLASMSYYHGHDRKMIDDINEVKIEMVLKLKIVI